MNPLVLNRWLRRLSVPILGIAMIAVLFSFGLERVPDARLLFTTGAVPGATCLVAKRVSHFQHGAVVFVSTADGLAVCRVDHQDGDKLVLMERGIEAFPDGIPLRSVRGLLLAVVSGASGGTIDDVR